MSQRIDLHDVLDRHSFSHAVICTYTFDPPFFEGYCLQELESLAENNNITVILDRGQNDQLLSAPASEWPALANVRYLLHPIAVPGVFHPKLFLFAGKDRGLLVIGSANFTKMGLTANAELVSVYRFERGKKEEHSAVFNAARSFLDAIAGRWPSDHLESNLHELEDDADWLASGDPSQDSPRLIHNLEQPLWPQILSGIPAPPEAVHVLSRFYDATPKLLDQVIRDAATNKVVLWTENDTTTLTSDWLRHPAFADRIATVFLTLVKDGKHRQPLHAKAIALVWGDRVRLAFGSANFTTPGLLRTCREGNVETMLLVDGHSLSDCDPARLFDPCGAAEELSDPGELRSARHEPQKVARAVPIELLEASLVGHQLKCLCAGMKDLAEFPALEAVLSFRDGGTARVRLQMRGDWLIGDVGERTVRECGSAATVVHLEAGVGPTDVLRSNAVFLINLQDFESGRGQRRERRVREAQRSARLFASALRELLELNDVDGLMNFLTHCDIPIVNDVRMSTGRRTKGVWEVSDIWRTLGVRNLREYSSLHDAAVGFCTRHISRLLRHCERATVSGLPNFMHITLAVASVLRAQVERALTGFEADGCVLSRDEWHGHRDHLETYLTLFRELDEVVTRQYLPALEERYAGSRIREALASDIQPMLDSYDLFLGVRDRLTTCLERSLRVQLPNGDLVVPPLFPQDLLGPARWREWSTGILEGKRDTVRWLSP